MSSAKTITKAALVTGGSAGGIGHATAVAFAKLGYKVAITGRDTKRLDQALKDMQEAAFNNLHAPQVDHFMAVEVDFSSEQQTDELIPRVVAKFGHLDILVNNAGYPGKAMGLLDAGYYDELKAVMQVNLFAPARLAQLAAPHLLRAPAGGVIINVSSVADRIPFSEGAYPVTKAGLTMLTKTMANSFEGKNVRVLTVSPGPIETNIVPGYRGNAPGVNTTLIKRSGTSDEVANVIVFLASEQASYMTGTTIDVDGGIFCKAGGLVLDAMKKAFAGNH